MTGDGIGWLDRIQADAEAAGQARRAEREPLVASPAKVLGQNADGSWAVGTESVGVDGVLYGETERFPSEQAAAAFVDAWNAHPSEWGGVR